MKKYEYGSKINPKDLHWIDTNKWYRDTDEYNADFLDRIYDILSKDTLNISDLVVLARTSNEDLPENDFINAKKAFYEIMHNYAEEWCDLDNRYPDNAFQTGYKIDDEIFVTGYSGVAGAYWNTDCIYIARPY